MVNNVFLTHEKKKYTGLLLFFLFLILAPINVSGHIDDDNSNHIQLDNGLKKLFIVEQGTTINNVVDKLKEEGYIDFKLWYEIVHRTLEKGSGVTPGGFKLSKEMSVFEIREALKIPDAVWVSLPAGIKRADITRAIGEALGWSEREKNSFRLAYTGIQWDHFNKILAESFAEIFDWEDVEQKAFMTMSSRYSDPKYDFLGTLYLPGEYLIPTDESPAQIAARLVDSYEKANAPYIANILSQKIDKSVVRNVHELVRGEVEDLPDLVPLPARDIGIEIGQSGQTLLVFTTTYWNDGDGPLELVVDLPSTPLVEDVDREVFQRIYRSDGSFRDRLTGSFLWHSEHLHYHFDDFVDYILKPVDVAGSMPVIGPLTKATFCIRDVEPIAENIPLGIQGNYSVCGFKRQGVSVGWGDSYFFTYADQFIDVTDLPNGTYELIFNVNPRGILEEMDLGNNTSSIAIFLDTINKTVEIVE